MVSRGASTVRHLDKPESTIITGMPKHWTSNERHSRTFIVAEESNREKERRCIAMVGSRRLQIRMMTACIPRITPRTPSAKRLERTSRAFFYNITRIQNGEFCSTGHRHILLGISGIRRTSEQTVLVVVVLPTIDCEPIWIFYESLGLSNRRRVS